MTKENKSNCLWKFDISSKQNKGYFLKEKQRLTSSNRLYTCEVRQNKNVFDLLGETKEENKALLFFSSGEAK